MANVKVRERPKDAKRMVEVAAGITLKDEGAHARWGWCEPESKRSMTRIANLKRQGYRPATEEDVVDMADAYKEPDGTIHRGDQILMVCNRAAVEERDLAARRTRESVERKQVKAIERDQGIETDDELHHQRAKGKEIGLA